MFKSVSELAVRLANLAEAEGRLARYYAIRLVVVAALALAATMTGLAAIGLLAAALMIALIPGIGAAWSAVVVAAILITFAAALALGASHVQKSAARGK